MANSNRAPRASAQVLRWGRSAYEVDEDLALERAAATALGFGWSAVPEDAAPPLDGVDVLVVTSRVQVTAQVLAQFSGSLVLTTTSGWEHIDTEAAAARGITVARCPLARRDAVAEATIGGILGLVRRQPALIAAAQRGLWVRSALPALDPCTVRESTVLVVGLGVIGAAVAQGLSALGATVLGVDPVSAPLGVLRVPLDEALPRADVVTLHCALNLTTRGLMSAERIAAMPPGSVLVNTARGALVDVAAALRAVETGHLRGLMLDVFPEEPYPDLATAAQIEGVWLTPHSSGYSRGLGQRVAREVADALSAWAAGLPVPNVVRGDG